MSNPVVTKSGFMLMTPEQLIETVRRIEASMAGWWWWFSQKKDALSVNVGPGRNCPHAPDNEYALTTAGDRGRSLEYSLSPGKFDEADFLTSLDQFILSFAPNRKLSGTGGKAPEVVTLGLPPFRRQSAKDLIALADTYRRFLESLPSLSARGHQLEEVYISSCDFSADCSLRGKRVDESEFDISFDLQGDATIAEAMSWSMLELNNDALTPR